MKSADIKPGIMLQITSWENDGDYYNTKTLTGLCEDEAKFWLGLAMLCGGEEYANLYESDELDKWSLCNDFIKLVNKHHSGYAVATAGWNVSDISYASLDEDDEERMESTMSLIVQLSHKVLGSSEVYSFRVFDDYKAYFFKEAPKVIDLE